MSFWCLHTSPGSPGLNMANGLPGKEACADELLLQKLKRHAALVHLLLPGNMRAQVQRMGFGVFLALAVVPATPVEM